MTTAFQLKTPPIFDYEACLKFLGRSPLECLFRIEDKTIKTLYPFGEDKIFVKICQQNDTGLSIHCSGFNSDESTVIEAVSQYIRQWLDLDTSLVDFYNVAKNSPVLAPLAKQFHGLRLIGIPSLFESLSWSVIGQQINLKFAYTIKKRLVENYGYSVNIDNINYYCFPEPEVVAGLTIDILKAIQFSRQKAEYIIGIAQIMSKGQLTKSHLAQFSFDEARKELVKIKGVGNWSANYVLMKCVRHPQAFPIEDVGLHNALKFQLGLDKKPSIDTIKQLAEPWGNWKAYATFYLWHSLLNG
ncbi:MAG: DNA-3-methyladenine glycosylase [Bacteroidota bacterium]